MLPSPVRPLLAFVAVTALAVSGRSTAADPPSLPTAVAWAYAISQDVQPDDGMEYFRHPSRAEIVEVLREAQRFAPIASEWAGYQIPWWIAWVCAQAESNHAIFFRKPDKGKARCAGFYGISVPAALMFGKGLPGCESMPMHNSAAICGWIVEHPKAQVRILFRMAAYYLRENGGNLYALWSIWHHGDRAGCDYIVDCRMICWRRFPWPKDGRLRRLR